MHVDQRQLRCFVEVVNCGSINRAALKLHIAQPALSRRVRQLEHSLGVALFVRTSDGVDLTVAGQRLYRRAGAWLDEFERLQQSMQNEIEGDTDVLRLGMAAGPTSLLLGRVMAAANSALADVRLRVMEGDRSTLLEQVLARQLDFAISTDVSEEPRIEREALWVESLYLVAPTGSRNTQASPPLFVVPTSDAAIERAVTRAAHSIGLVAGSGIAVTPTASVKRLILAGVARSVLPFSAIHEELRLGLLDAYPIADATIERHLIWLRDRAHSAAAATLHLEIGKCVDDMLATFNNDSLRRVSAHRATCA